MTQMWDVVIVGGGLAGYVAANSLVRNDLSILILEKGKISGGRARTNSIHQQYFNLGPHAFYKTGKAKTILEELGINLHGNTPKLGGLIVENHKQYTAPFSALGIFATNLLNWKERIEWITLLMKVHHIDPGKLDVLTFEKWVKQAAHSKRVQSLLFLLGRLATYCHAPERVSAKLMLSHLKTVIGGVLYLDGGWQSIIDQLHNKAVMAGVHVQTHTAVKQMVPVEQGGIKLFLSNGVEIFGKNVICTTAPNEFIKLLCAKVHFPQRSFFTQIPTVKGSTLDVALSQLPNPKRLFAMSLSAPLYFSVHSNYARLSKDGNSAIMHVFKYHHPDDHIDPKIVQNELEQFLEKLQPGWQTYKITSRYIPQMIVNQRLPQIGDEQNLLRSKTDIPGLYIAGDWADPHSQGAVSSGKQAAEEILQKEMR